MFELRELGLEGCVELQPVVRSDARGRFVKTVHASTFEALGLRSDFVEQYHSTSSRGVVRGLHFQAPPAAHAKLVTCLAGRIFDVALDLRRSSASFGRFAHLELDAERANQIYLPVGVAHGFWTLSEHAVVLYSVTSEYAPSFDRGVLWSSAGIPWPGEAPVISDRDAGFPTLAALHSPFE